MKTFSVTYECPFNVDSILTGDINLEGDLQVLIDDDGNVLTDERDC